MRRLLAIPLLLLALAACGGDDDDDDVAADTDDTTEETDDGGDDEGEEPATSDDFCEIWPSFNTGEFEDISEVSQAEIDEARDALDSVFAAAPSEIRENVQRIGRAVSDFLTAMESGGEPTEEQFGALLGVALEDGPVIEEWLVANCEGYEPQIPDGGDMEVSAPEGKPFDAEIFGDGWLGVSGEELTAIFDAAFPEGQVGFGGGGDDTAYDWSVDITGDVDVAIAGCESVAAALAEHADFTGTLTLTVAQWQSGDDPDTEEVEFDFETVPLVKNDAITPGSPGECAAV